MRRLALISFAFSASVFVSQYFLSGMLPLYAGAGAAVFMLISLFLKNEKVRPVKFIAAGLTLGFIWCYGFDRIYVEPARELDQVTDSFRARVTGIAQDTDYGYSAGVRLIVPGAPDIKAMLYVNIDETDSASRPEPGDVISFEAKAAQPGKKNGEDYYTPRGVLLLLYSKQAPEITESGRNILYLPVRLAELLNGAAERIFPPDVHPFMKALLTGDRNDLNKDSLLLSELSTTGTAHTVAVSGMHMVFLVGMIRFIAGKSKKTAFICIPLILFYMAMTGNTPSVARSGIMQIMLLAAPLLMREYDSLTALGFSLMLLLALNPLSARHAGLQMSFASVLGLILFSEKLNGNIRTYITGKKKLSRLLRIKPLNSLTLFIISSFSVTLSAMVFIVPLTAVNFGLVSLIAPLANLLILPVLSFVFSAGLLLTALGAIFQQAGSLLSFIVVLPVRYILWITGELSDLPFTALYSRNIYISAWIVFFYALLGIVIFSKSLRKKPLWLLASSAAMLAMTMLLSGIQVNSYPLSVTMLDVGQGQSIVLSSYDRTVVVDCGGNRMKNAGDNVSEYIMSQGKNHLDMLILTHYHSDHSNGILQLMRRLVVDTIVIPDIPDPGGVKEGIISYAKSAGIDIIYVSDSREMLKLGAMNLSVIPPLGDDGANELGLSVICSAGDFDIMITGDIDSETEYMLLEYTAAINTVIPDTEVLVAGHHGSKYSTSEDLINAAKPEIVLISTGYNTYGHPSEDLISRLYRAGIRIYRTDQCGEISIKANVN